MAKSKYSEFLIRMICDKCKQVNYYTRKNKKKVERKLELLKFCRKCRKRTKHKEKKK
ncbi:MAG: 50S ribosomal protein L33 [Candidatus Liptonbacteria bacterium RIFOXYC1_FULL_36_8]|uniref:Large ribosomal subunit protein bL33 n=2 Tax=Candidatus Liptoniibacteriota TaxID=1817909 RepID=A0A1G2CSN1_9BACT|nr:MAG: 50S ribosomal protein L33 [Candidatus Liptonbacteria bacterium RIFOXYB1_FULL_36_10]OGZ04224.1 MAG: 50S ribosomal protein L33 [Candidatus Liptonbacteria bacterium RIFOXYC1_FULL_36_8]